MCAFIPGSLHKDSVKELALSINGPLNIIANPLFHDFVALKNMGVKRLSIGSGASRAALSSVISTAKELTRGSIESLISHNFSYKEANDYFS